MKSMDAGNQNKKDDRLRSRAKWAPQAKQEDALSRPEFEIGFGGSRGGGKTDAGIAWLGYDSTEPRMRGVVIRKNTVDLGEWLLRLREVHPRVKVFGNPPVIKFPDKDGNIERTKDGELKGGATYFTGHLKDKGALSKYVGQNLQRALIEELNLIPSEEQYVQLLASIRSTIPNVKAQVFSTFNPDNVGHTWIKRRFRLAGIPRSPIITKDEKTGRMRIFIPSTVDDNPALALNDPDYVSFLNGLPDGLREQWRWGSWDDPIIKGAYFTMELAQMRREHRICDLPVFPELSVHTFWDIGNDTTAIWFLQFVDNWIHLVDFYMNDSLGFPFYLAKLQEFRETRGYSYGMHHFPHDFNKMEWGSGRERKEVLESRNIDYEILERPQDKQGSIDAARLLFPRLKIDRQRCAQGLDALINYRKEWSEERQTFTDKPVHDWASHPADALQQIALANLDTIAPPKRASEMLRKETKELGVPQRLKSAEFADSFPGAEPGRGGRFHYDE